MSEVPKPNLVILKRQHQTLEAQNVIPQALWAVWGSLITSTILLDTFI
jgi:hypothetical protein